KWKSYRGLDRLGYQHEVEDETYCYDGENILPNVHRVAALLKRWLLGTHQNFVSQENLDFYLDEFVFRHNRRNAKSRGSLFKTVLEQAVLHSPITNHAVMQTSVQ
ncbi:MAG: transposase, partial [Candidatus Riflebacteria bacterium]|nr:transposase [Candidatus Riflebacteria bacterium]